MSIFYQKILMDSSVRAPGCCMTVHNTKNSSQIWAYTSSTAVMVKWKDQFPSALKIERATLLFKWPLCSNPFTYPKKWVKLQNFFYKYNCK